MAFVGFESDAGAVVKQLGAQIERDSRRVYVGLQGATREMGNLATGLYRQTVATWKHKPTFKLETDITSTLISVAISTDDPVFRYVDQGTRPHFIKPKAGKVLAFQGNYFAKTSPGSLRSGPGGASGATYFTRKPVRHPGTAARDFTGQIQREVDRQGPKILERELRRALGG